MRTALVLAGLLAALPTPSLAKQVNGVEFPESTVVEGKSLTLNGAGLRKKKVLFVGVDVYVAGLYVEAPSKDPAALVAADAPWVVRMVFLRDVDQKAIVNAFHEGFEANSKDQAAALAKQLDGAKQAIGDVKKGQELLVTYAPGAGTTIKGPGGEARVEGKGFADGLLRNWIGPHPTDGELKDLKKKLLGG
ncbi:MAG: chalcone isomerase family protein [Anaeromyxobacter sp.]